MKTDTGGTIAQMTEPLRSGFHHTLIGEVLGPDTTLVPERFPNASICAFAMVRTIGLQPDIERIVEPCLGIVRRNRWSDAERDDGDMDPAPRLF